MMHTSSPCSFIRCPPGEVYCLEGGHCAPKCNEDPFSFGEDAFPGFQCPKGTIFCLESGQCMENCHREKRDQGKALWREESVENEGLNQHGCSGNRKFCPNFNACMNDCGVLEEDNFHSCKIGLVSLKILELFWANLKEKLFLTFEFSLGVWFRGSKVHRSHGIFQTLGRFWCNSKSSLSFWHCKSQTEFRDLKVQFWVLFSDLLPGKWELCALHWGMSKGIHVIELRKLNQSRLRSGGKCPGKLLLKLLLKAFDNFACHFSFVQIRKILTLVPSFRLASAIFIVQTTKSAAQITVSYVNFSTDFCVI